LPRSAKQTTASAIDTPIAEPNAAIDASAILKLRESQIIYNFVKFFRLKTDNHNFQIL